MWFNLFFTEVLPAEDPIKSVLSKCSFIGESIWRWRKSLLWFKRPVGDIWLWKRLKVWEIQERLRKFSHGGEWSGQGGDIFDYNVVLCLYRSVSKEACQRLYLNVFIREFLIRTFICERFYRLDRFLDFWSNWFVFMWDNAVIINSFTMMLM